MREIKFRAWNREQRFMDSAWLIDWEHYEVCHAHHNQSDLDDCELMQFTGLRDKIGREICEGDIVRFNAGVGTVVFECGCYGIGFTKSVDYNSMLERIHEYTGCDNSLHVCANDNFISLWEIFWNFCEEECLSAVEVIGNIYENQELLEA